MNWVLGLESLKRAQERVSVKVQPAAARDASDFEDAAIMGASNPWSWG